MKRIIAITILIHFFDPTFGQGWKQYVDSAKYFQALNKIDKSINYYSKAKHELERKSFWSYDNAVNSYNLAALYNNMHQYAKAEPLFIEARLILDKVLGKSNTEYARACFNLAVFYYNLFDNRQALELMKEAKDIFQKILGTATPEYLQSCNNLALIYWSMGQNEKAEMLQLEMKKFWAGEIVGPLGRSSGNLTYGVREYAVACINLANVYQGLGQYAKAEPMYIESKQALEKLFGKLNPDYASVCNSVACLYWATKEHKKAEQLFLEAKQIQEKVLGKKNLGYVFYSSNLAMCYSGLGQHAKAELLYLEAIQLDEELFGELSAEYARSCNNLANHFFWTDQYEKAEPLFLKAKEIFEKICGKQNQLYGGTCGNLAKFYWVLNQPLQAEEQFRESFYTKIHNLDAAFRFNSEKGKSDYVKNILGNDNQIYSFYLSEKIQSGEPYSISLFHRNLILSASQDLQKQLFDSDDKSIINKYSKWISIKKHLATIYSKPLNERNEDVAAREEEADQLEKDLTLLSSTFKEQRQRVDWKDIQNKLHPGEASIEFASFQYYDGKRYTDSIFYVAFVLRKDISLPVTTFLFTEKQITSLLVGNDNITISDNDRINKLYASEDANKHNGTSDTSIYRLVWKPLEQVLKDIKTIYFAPAGLLHRIAFAALPVNASEVLSDRYKLVQLASTASVTDQTSTFITSDDNLQLYGGIKYDADSMTLKQSAQFYTINPNKEITRSIPADLTRSGSFNYLPGTQTEIETIQKQAKETQSHILVSSGIYGTEESFKVLNGKKSPAVIHIATHGFFFPDPKKDSKDAFQRSFEDNSGKVFKQSDNPLFRSGLVFAGGNLAWHGKSIAGVEDGILTAYEVSNMYLPNTKLVVLSACETALGAIEGSEGVYGLQRSFKIAGVQNLVMSLWKVSDEGTAEFMQLFYKNLFDRQSVTDAFYQAQGIMKNKYRNNPFMWAAWILVK